MMESTTTAAIIAAISAWLLSVLGVEYYALLYATIAASSMLLFSNAKTSRKKALMVTLSSALLGAAMGTALAEHLNAGSRSMLMLSCILCASGTRPLIAAGVNALVARIEKTAGSPASDGESPPNT